MSKNKIGKVNNKTETRVSAKDFPVIGIGASAGGLDAFKQLPKAIPVNSRTVYGLVQHSSPANESKLTEIHTGIIPGKAIRKKEKHFEYLNFFKRTFTCTKTNNFKIVFFGYKTNLHFTK